MFDWLGDIFNEDTFKTLVGGLGAAAPLINAASQIGLGFEGTRNAGNLRDANAAAIQKLDELFTPAGPYAQELRKQMERKDAAAGRRSQYGTRETELMTNLAKQRAAVLQSPAYQNYLTGANRSAYGPLGGAVGNLTGGRGQSGLLSNASNAKSAYQAGEYLANLFGPGAEASIASLGGAGSALGGGMGGAATGTTDILGSLLGGSPYLPGYEGQATGIFGQGGQGAQAGGQGQGGLLGDAGSVLTGAGDLAAAGLGGAGSALSGMGAGSLAGTVGATDALGGILGGTGFLPSYGAAGGASASGIFGGGAAASGAAGSGAGAAGGTAASGALGGAPVGVAGAAALPFIIAALGMTGMFDDDIERPDIVDWQSRANPMNDISMGYGEFTPLANEDYNTYLNRVRGVSDYGTSKWDPNSEPFVQQYYNRMQQDVFQPQAQGQGPTGWASLYDSYGGGD